MEVVVVIGGLILFGLMVAGLKSAFNETPAKQLDDARREGYEAAQRAAEDDAKASGSRYEADLYRLSSRVDDLVERLSHLDRELTSTRSKLAAMEYATEEHVCSTLDKHEAMIRACASEISSIERDRRSRPVARFVD